MRRNFVKSAFVAFLTLLTTVRSLAQKDVFYTDLGISMARFIPGLSLTYNHTPIKYVGLGAGVQVYDFHATMTNFQMIPTIFGELRLNIAPENPRRFYVFVDIGYNFYRHNNNIWVEGDEKYVVTGDNGRYTGAGIAYAWEVGDGDMLLYVSLKMIDNSYNVRSVNTISNVETADLLDRGTLVPSFGIRF